MARFARGLLIVLAAVIVAGAGLGARYGLSYWTRRQLVAQHGRRIATLDEPAAARAVRELVALDHDAPRVLVPLLTDQRPAVAAAAGQTLEQLFANWSRLRTPDAAPRVALLARELAAIGPKLSPHQRRAAHNLAMQLIVWPLDAETGSRGQVVADCEVVLRLPLAAGDEPRIAAAPQREPSPPQESPDQSPPPLATELPAPLPAANQPPFDPDAPRVFGPVEPERLIDASQERPERPKQFLPPRALKIEG
jgi:hypothetical protein